MEIVYGTGNHAKLTHMQRRLAPLGLTLVGLDAFGPLPAVAETGTTPLENARIKAHAYHAALHRPVFSCDSGLYFDEVPESLQPGIHVRTPQGTYLDDDAMIEYYGALARRFGGLTARYRNAICLILDGEHVWESDDPCLWGRAFRLVGEPHSRREAGFPLDSLSVNLATGLYYHDMPESLEDYGLLNDGFRTFFREALGL